MQRHSEVPLAGVSSKPTPKMRQIERLGQRSVHFNEPSVRRFLSVWRVQASGSHPRAAISTAARMGGMEPVA